MISTVSFSIVEENYGFIKLTYVKSQTCNLTFFCCFLTNFDCGKKYGLFRLFRNNPIQRNIRKRNQFLGMAIASDTLLVTKQVWRCQKDWKCDVFFVRQIMKPGFHLQQTPWPRHKKQSYYVLELSSLPLIALFWLKIGRCRGRNRLYGNQALVTTKVQFWWVV